MGANLRAELAGGGNRGTNEGNRYTTDFINVKIKPDLIFTFELCSCSSKPRFVPSTVGRDRW